MKLEGRLVSAVLAPTPASLAGLAGNRRLAAVELLGELTQGADARAQSPYGLPSLAPDSLIHWGSCTANPITPAVLARHQQLQIEQAWPDPQQHLLALFGAEQCRLAASGTDAEYTCALAMGSQPYLCVLMDPNEIGGGCARAAAGQAHAAGCPVDAPLPVQALLACTRLRDVLGQALTQAEVDEQVWAIIAQHPHLPVLLHHVACSKTGLCAPSEAACLSIQRSHGAEVRVVVDASQGRFAPADVRRWLGHGWAVIVTGSKYFGAPPFCGATLFPAGWPQAQGFAVGPGLRARWALALDAMQVGLGATPSAQQHKQQAQRQQRGEQGAEVLQRCFVRPLLRAHGRARSGGGAAAAGLIDDAQGRGRQGILSFDLGLSAGKTLLLHRSLIARGCFIGQPVAAGPRSLLRVAWSAQTVPERAADGLERLARSIQHELAHG